MFVKFIETLWIFLLAGNIFSDLYKIVVSDDTSEIHIQRYCSGHQQEFKFYRKDGQWNQNFQAGDIRIDLSNLSNPKLLIGKLELTLVKNCIHMQGTCPYMIALECPKLESHSVTLLEDTYLSGDSFENHGHFVCNKNLVANFSHFANFDEFIISGYAHIEQELRNEPSALVAIGSGMIDGSTSNKGKIVCAGNLLAYSVFNHPGCQFYVGGNLASCIILNGEYSKFDDDKKDNFFSTKIYKLPGQKDFHYGEPPVQLGWLKQKQDAYLGTLMGVEQIWIIKNKNIIPAIFVVLGNAQFETFDNPCSRCYICGDCFTSEGVHNPGIATWRNVHFIQKYVCKDHTPEDVHTWKTTTDAGKIIARKITCSEQWFYDFERVDQNTYYLQDFIPAIFMVGGKFSGKFERYPDEDKKRKLDYKQVSGLKRATESTIDAQRETILTFVKTYKLIQGKPSWADAVTSRNDGDKYWMTVHIPQGNIVTYVIDTCQSSYHEFQVSLKNHAAVILLVPESQTISLESKIHNSKKTTKLDYFFADMNFIPVVGTSKDIRAVIATKASRPMTEKSLPKIIEIEGGKEAAEIGLEFAIKLRNKIIDTKVGQKSFKEEMLQKKYWRNCPGKRDLFQDAKNEYRYYLPLNESRIEVYKKIDGKWLHYGVVRPSEGVIRTEFAKWTELNEIFNRQIIFQQEESQMLR